MKFSIVIPVYNAEKTIGRTIKSCLEQSFQDFEMILVNDGSTDRSIEIIHETSNDNRIKVLSLIKNSGVSEARNKGWDIARGDYVCFLDSDDIWHPEKLEIISNIINRDNFICVAHFYTDEWQRLGEGTGHQLKLNFWSLLLRNYFNTSCIAIKRDSNFRFNGKMRYTEDHELLIRISSKQPITYLSSKLTLLGRPQLSKGGLSGNKWKMRKGEMKMYISAARCNLAVFAILPFLFFFCLLKHLIKIFDEIRINGIYSSL